MMENQSSTVEINFTRECVRLQTGRGIPELQLLRFYIGKTWAEHCRRDYADGCVLAPVVVYQPQFHHELFITPVTP